MGELLKRLAVLKAELQVLRNLREDHKTSFERFHA